MSTISLSIYNPNNGFDLVKIETDSDMQTVKSILQNNYNTLESTQQLFTGKNISSLTNEEIVFSTTDSLHFNTVDIQESEITTEDFNFVFFPDQGWLVREFNGDNYHAP